MIDIINPPIGLTIVIDPFTTLLLFLSLTPGPVRVKEERS
jgi:small neutral amino acid transporter SnatA (MarC family)